MNINLIIYGEDGEVEYGGSNLTKDKPFFDSMYIKKIYFEGGYDEVLKRIKAQDSQKIFFRFPSDNKLKKSN